MALNLTGAADHKEAFMNDDQTDAMIAALANIFDKAATTCSHKKEAAMFIRAAMHKAGFVIVPKRAAAIRARGE